MSDKNLPEVFNAGDITPVMGFDSAIASLEKGLQLADALVKAGVFPNGMDKYKAFAVLLKGKELNIPPMQAATSLYVVNGRVAMEAQLMLALIYRSPQFESVKFEEDDKSFTTILKRKGHEPVTYRFSTDDAVKMQYTDKAGKLQPLVDKFNWKTMLKIMLKWRSISGCARMAFPDIIMGLYTPDEMGMVEVADESGASKVVITFDEAYEYERILKELNKFDTKTPKEDLDFWLEKNKVDLEKLPEKKVAILRPIFESFYSKFRTATPNPQTFQQPTTEVTDVKSSAE